MATQKKGVVKYKVKAVKVAGDMTGKKRYQAQVVNSSVMEFDQFVDHMAEHSSPYTRGTISGVLTDMLDCLKEQILDGKQVRLGDLGLISVGIDGKSAETLEAWNVQQNVTGLHLLVRNTKTWSNQQLRSHCRLVEAGTYVSGESAKEQAGE